MEKDYTKGFFQNPWVIIIALLLGGGGTLTGTGLIPINQKEQQEIITAEEIGAIVAPIVQTAVKETMNSFYENQKDPNQEALKDFIHRIDTDHGDCSRDFIDSGVERVQAEIACTLQRNSEILIRNLE